VIVPPGVNVRTGVLFVPLLSVRPAVCLKSVVLVAPKLKAASVTPVKVMPAAAVLPLVLKSMMPLLVKSPPMESTCVVTVPVAADWTVPLLATVTD
jgi:hypothetical protein